MWNGFSNQTLSTMMQCPDFLAIKDVVQNAENSVEDTLTICCKLYGKNSHQHVSDGDIACTKISVDRHNFKLEVRRGETAKHSFTLGSNRNFVFSITETLGNIYPMISKLDSESKEGCFADCTLTLDKIYRCETYSEKAKHYFPANCCLIWEFPSAILSNEWKNYINYCQTNYFPPYFVTIHCEFSFSSGTNFKFCVPRTESPSIPSKTNASLTTTTTHSMIYRSLQEDLRDLFHSKMCSDVKLRVGNEIIEVHKTVLVARSPVFAVMFNNDMAETQTGIVNIVDIDGHILKLFLYFLYTDTVDELEYEVVINLMMAAEKYQVLALKEKCSILLKNEMSVENVCEILSLANAVNHEYLKSTSIEFIIASSATILSSPQWIPWIKNNMESAAAIFEKLKLSHS